MTTEEKANEICKRHIFDSNIYDCCMEMAEWKDEQFWLYQNIEQIIKTYKSFPDRSCPSELVKKTIEKLKPQK